jgi:hypothetical protein
MICFKDGFIRWFFIWLLTGGFKIRALNSMVFVSGRDFIYGN